MELFPSQHIVGVFRGFREGGLEFHAELVLPYHSDLRNAPMHGQFLLVQLETADEAVLGRITSFASEGKLSIGSGEEFSIRAVRDGRDIPEELREQYLKYRVNIRVLGVLRAGASGLTFVASHRRLPHVGSPVAFLSDEMLQEVASHNDDGVAIGHYALGEYVYHPQRARAAGEDWMQLRAPEVQVRFAVQNLVARRSFIFARAGFGKSNLNKLLFSQLYESTPTVTKRGGSRVPVGTVIFDPDGEYFWPDDKGRPGFCDVPHLKDQLVVFTSRAAPSAFYESFVAGRVRLDIRGLPPADVVSIALSMERQEQQNVLKLRGLSPTRWRELVDLIYKEGHGASENEVAKLLSMDPNSQKMEALAARSNMTTIVRMLHDPSSQLMSTLMRALKEGKLCVVDVSQMRGYSSMILAGLILRKIFAHNQEQFTAKEPETIPTIAVIEEAQSVLNDSSSTAEPYIAWVKEGRKYDLGAVLVTQQPGAIPAEILSQGDNWFLFHLLSAGDLGSARRANAHFSDDILSSLLNEPIPGQGVFWSSASRRPYPIALRVLSFEAMHRVADATFSAASVSTFGAELKTGTRKVEAEARRRGSLVDESEVVESVGADAPKDAAPPIDMEKLYERVAYEAIEEKRLVKQLKGRGVAWGSLKATILDALSKFPDDGSHDHRAYYLVAVVLERMFGAQERKWHTFKNKSGTTYVRTGPKPADGKMSRWHRGK